ncbi:twin-arginine translocation signal domain-containing protein [Luteimonas soli]|uniref:Twin-arginine translocation signal domain-containing protein n=1 Tax=Luteimonas soli TaxID=1648966 RepID=A0ABV7XHA1_9GAMM
MDRISRRRFVAGLAAAPALGLVGLARSEAPSLISHNAYYVNSTKTGSDYDLSIGALALSRNANPDGGAAAHRIHPRLAA